jgi:secreted trypsin-like serine protease
VKSIERFLSTFTYPNVPDVMLLILQRPATHPIIRLNNIINIPETNEVLQTIGFGREDINAERASEILQELNVTYVGQDVCARHSLYTDDMICTKGFNESGTCRGDSGGPLLQAGVSSDIDLQIGIVSFSSLECVHRKFFFHVKPHN